MSTSATAGAASTTGRTDYDVATGDVPKVRGSAEEKGNYVFARYAAQNDHYLGFYQQWAKTVLFLLGKQWLKWLSDRRRYTTNTDVLPWYQQPVTNVTFAVFRTLMAKLTKQKPTYEVVPPSGDSDDKESARLAEALLVHFWRALKIEAKRRRGIGWFLCTGQVYLRVHWDPDAGKRVPRTTLVEHPESGEDVDCACDEDGEPYATKDGQPDLQREPDRVPEGDVAFDIESPMAVRFDAEATDAEDAREMYVAKLWTRRRAASHFGLPEEALDVSSGDGQHELYDDLLSSAAAGTGLVSRGGDAGSLGANNAEALGTRVLVIEYYRKPDDERPDGAHWITVGRQKVWPKAAQEAPLPNGFWPPLIPVLDLAVPGQPQAMGVLPQVVPLNEQLNTLDGKILEDEVTMMMGGKWIVHPDDKGIRITSDPAQVIASKGYAQGKPPVQADLKPLPAPVYAERTVIMDKVRLVASLSEAELGRKPEGVNAGRAFLVLQEVTDSSLGPALQAWEEALEEAGRRMLVLVQRHYREDRTIQIRGERGQWEVRSFTGADLTDGLDVRVQVGSSFPWSRAAQQDTKLNILSTFPGLVTDLQTGVVDQERLSQFLDVSGSGLSSFESDEDPDLVEIQREHDMFCAIDPSKGEQQVPQVAFWQDHAKHLKAHYDFMKRDYGRFERMTPAAQQAFLAHMQQTLQATEELAQQAVDAAQPAPNGPGPLGAPGDAPPDGAPPSAPDASGPVGGGLGTMTAAERPTLGASDFASAGAMAGA